MVFQSIGDWGNLSFSLCVFIVHITRIMQNIDLFSFFKDYFSWLIFAHCSLQVSFNSLDLILHSEALLSTLNFLSVALSSGNTDREIRPTTEDQMLATKSSQCQQKCPRRMASITDVGVTDI